MMPLVSVVVPTHRRDAMLKRCLDALLTQSLDAKQYEMILADDGASECTHHLVCEMAQRAGAPCIRYLPMPKHNGPAAARNLGWRNARGKFIAFTDDDTVPDVDWLLEGVIAFDDDNLLAERVDAVAGRTIVPISDAPTDYERNVAGLQHAEFITANCFLRREMLERLGGFDEDFKLAFREDCDLYFRLLQAGGRVLFTPRAIVVHPVRPVPWGVSVQMEKKNMYDALLYKKHAQLYRERISREPNWRYYRIVGTLLLTLFGLSTRRRRLALGAAASWAAMTGSFTIQRLNNTARTPEHVAEMLVTSAFIPPLSLYWRLRGALKYRVFFL